MNEDPTHIDLFSGIGGFALAAAWAGFRTIAFCEIDTYCQAVLRKHWSAVPTSTDVRKLDGRGWKGAALLTAGVPCQPASEAGQRRGAEDDRWLWPEALRVTREALPLWAVYENPFGIATLERGVVLDGLLSELEGIGYEVAPPLVIPACAVKAGHIRKRVFIVAHFDSSGSQTRAEHGAGERPSILSDAEPGGGGQIAADAQSQQVGFSRQPRECKRLAAADTALWPETDFGLLRTVHGFPTEPHRRARIHALGNSVIPAQAFPILRGIRESLK